MPVFTALTTASLATLFTAASATAGLAATGYGAYQQMEGAKDASAASRRAEMARKKQMNLEYMRTQREALRVARARRAEATSNLSNAGAIQGSAYGGMLGQIQGDYGRAAGNAIAGFEIGNQIFDANADLASAQSRQATGTAISGFGKALFENSVAIGNIGETLFAGNPSSGGGYSGGYKTSPGLGSR